MGSSEKTIPFLTNVMTPPQVWVSSEETEPTYSGVSRKRNGIRRDVKVNLVKVAFLDADDSGRMSRNEICKLRLSRSYSARITLENA